MYCMALNKYSIGDMRMMSWSRTDFNELKSSKKIIIESWNVNSAAVNISIQSLDILFSRCTCRHFKFRLSAGVESVGIMISELYTEENVEVATGISLISQSSP